MQVFHAQGQDMASLLLDYQVRHYPLPDKRGLTLSGPQLQALDQSIQQRFDELLQGQAADTEVVAKAKANYQFVRSQLLQEKGRVHSGAEFYLTRAVLDLYELAAQLIEVQG